MFFHTMNRYGIFSFCLLFIGLSGPLQAEADNPLWELHIEKPGTYELEVIHVFGKEKDKNTRLLYTMRTDQHTFSKPLFMQTFQSDRPFRLFLTDIYRPQTITVAISGVSPTLLKKSIIKETKIKLLKQPTRFDVLWRDGSSPDIERIKGLLSLSEDQIDLAYTKLIIDQMVEPSIDLEANLKKIDRMVAEIKAMLPEHPTAADKVSTLRRYLYQAGKWNNGQPYQYNFDDPLGTDIHYKLLPTYMTSKKGNCISMPFLFAILGERLGLSLNISTTPLHVFVKYNEPGTGMTYNLETTSGANPSRDAWYRQQMPMTDEAIQNGVYLRSLSKKETVAAMARLVTEHYSHEHQYEKVIELSELLLEYNPMDAELMVKKGSAFFQLLEKHFLNKYQNLNLIPAKQRGYFEYLSDNNRFWFAKAESLGWREPPSDYDEKYLQMVKQDAKQIQ